jgi:hypothetical protein
MRWCSGHWASGGYCGPGGAAARRAGFEQAVQAAGGFDSLSMLRMAQARAIAVTGQATWVPQMGYASVLWPVVLHDTLFVASNAPS